MSEPPTMQLSIDELLMLIQALAADGAQQGRARADLLQRLRDAVREARS